MFTPEEQQQLANAYARMQLAVRYSPPPAEEADLWEQGIMDLEHEGVTYWGIPVWHPKALADEWYRRRFPRNPSVTNERIQEGE